MHQPNLYEIAYHFCTSYITGATVPHTRLSNILENLFHARPISPIALGYLQKQGLTELYKLATGQLTYEAYIAALDPALVAREKAARNVLLTAQKKTRLHGAKLTSKKLQQPEAIKAARNLKRIGHDSETTEINAVQIPSKHHREIVLAIQKVRINTANAQPPTAGEIAEHFRMHLRPDANPLNPPLRNILESLYQGIPLTSTQMNYLKAKGFIRLHELASGEVTYDTYTASIDANERAREAAVTARLAQHEEDKRWHEAAEAARVAREDDPAYRLRKKYDVEGTPQPLLPRMMAILQDLDEGKRITDDNLVWLKTTAKNYFSETLQKNHHLCEAKFFTNEFFRTRGPWKAINASGHFRKCKQPEDALQLLDQITASHLKEPKTHSAFCTTRGGALRDLGRLAEALELGKKAHHLQPKSFQPCTLLGALYIEIGNYTEGHDWYAEAEQRGASLKSIDNELRMIYLRAEKAKRQEMRKSLLSIDPVRYNWVNNIKDGYNPKQTKHKELIKKELGTTPLPT